VVAFQQMIQFVQDQSGSLFGAEPLQGGFVLVQPPVLIHGQRAETGTRDRDHRQNGMAGEGPMATGPQSGLGKDCGHGEYLRSLESADASTSRRWLEEAETKRSAAA
jgi:hypothetical protein